MTLTLWFFQRTLVEARQFLRIREQVGHALIQIDQRHDSTFGYFNISLTAMPSPRREPYPPGPGQTGETGMDQRLMVAVLVARRELQVAVEPQAQIVLPARDDDALIGSAFGVDHLVAKDAFLDPAGQRVRCLEARHQEHQHRDAPDPPAPRPESGSCLNT